MKGSMKKKNQKKILKNIIGQYYKHDEMSPKIPIIRVHNQI